MNMRAPTVLLALLIGVVLPVQAKDDPSASARAWLGALHEWAIPRYQRFAERSQSLTTAIDEACAAGPAPQRIAALQQQWVDLTQTWRQLEALQLGATLQRRSARTIDFWPTRPNVIEQAARMTADAPVSGPQADDAMVRWGTAAKGMPALEWLLFPESGKPLPLWHTPAQCLYARRVARGVAAEAAALLDAWRAQAGRWAAAPETEVNKTVSDTLNLLVGSCELLRGKKLQKGARVLALGGRESGVTFAFDSVRSGRSRAFLLAHFEALAQLLLGRETNLPYVREGPKMGLANLLVAQGHARQAAPLAAAVQKAHKALSALPADPQQWSVARTEAASQSLRDLRQVIDPPIAQALHVTITFTDADGD